MAAYPTMPGSVSAPNAADLVTQLVPHEDAPAFSDIASTATLAATSPLTTFSPTTPVLPMSVPQKKSKEKAEGTDKVEPTAHSLTTQVTPNNRGDGSENSGLASLSSQRSQPQGWGAFPEEAASGKIEKGGASEPAKNRTSPSHQLHKLISASSEKETTTMSTTVTTTTTITTMQPSGRHVFFCLTFKDVVH